MILFLYPYWLSSLRLLECRYKGSLPLTDMWYINGRVESLPLTNMRIKFNLFCFREKKYFFLDQIYKKNKSIYKILKLFNIYKNNK